MNSSSEGEGANSSLEALLSEGACRSDDDDSLMEQSLPEAGKTPTTLVQGMDLAAVVYGGSGVEHVYSTSSQGRHVSSINTSGKVVAFASMPVNNNVEIYKHIFRYVLVTYM